MSDDALLEEINAASSSETPVMPSPFPGEVSLLRGLYAEETKEWHTSAVVRELNGRDEEHLAEVGSRPGVTYVDYMSNVLESAVVSVGELSATAQVIDKLILPDRDLLFLAIVKATYGAEREVSVMCSQCDERQNIVLELDEDFPILGIGEDLRSLLSVTFRDGSTHEFRYPTGEFTSYASKHGETTPEINTYLIAQCLVTDLESPLKARLEWARELGVADRKSVEKTLTESVTGVGPQLGEVDTRCAKCNAEMPLLMDWVSLLLG